MFRLWQYYGLQANELLNFETWVGCTEQYSSRMTKRLFQLCIASLGGKNQLSPNLGSCKMNSSFSARSGHHIADQGCTVPVCQYRPIPYEKAANMRENVSVLVNCMKLLSFCYSTLEFSFIIRKPCELQCLFW